MFNLPLWLLLVQSGRGVKAINRHAGLFISLQVKSWCWYSCNKACFHCEEFGSTVFSLRGSSFCLPEIDDHVKAIVGARFEVSYQQFKSQVPPPVRKKKEFLLQGKQCEADINPEVYVLHEWEEGKIEITEWERKWQRDWKRQFPLFLALLVRGG